MPRQRPETKPEFIANYVGRIHKEGGELVGFAGPQNKLVSSIGSARKYASFKSASAGGSRFVTTKGPGVRRSRTGWYYEVVTVESSKALTKDAAMATKFAGAKRKIEKLRAQIEDASNELFKFPLANGGHISVSYDGSGRFMVATHKPNSEDRQVLRSVDRTEAFEKAMRLVKASTLTDEILDMGDLMEAEGCD